MTTDPGHAGPKKGRNFRPFSLDVAPCTLCVKNRVCASPAARAAHAFARIIAGIAVFVASCGLAGAASFTFGAFGDTPYTAFEEAQFPALVAEINKETLAFLVHVGDFKSGRAPCSDELYLQRRRWFDEIRHPFVFVPGDNDWADCHSRHAGSYDPRERLAKLRELFAHGNESLGKRRMKLERQNGGYPEHTRWRYEDMLFVTLNVPGHDNNVGVLEEFRARSTAVDQWLAQSFDVARQARLHGVAIFMQANPWFGLMRTDTGFRDLMRRLASESSRFDGAVLLVHGDTHRPIVDQPLVDPDTGAPIRNFTRVEVFGSPNINWVKIRVHDRGTRVEFEASQGSWSRGDQP